MSAPVMDVNGAVTGHIISTTIGGKNGEPKQVKMMSLWIHEYLLVRNSYASSLKPEIEDVFGLLNNLLQTVSYMAERVVGTGSFGVVFQASEHTSYLFH